MIKYSLCADTVLDIVIINFFWITLQQLLGFCYCFLTLINIQCNWNSYEIAMKVASKRDFTSQNPDLEFWYLVFACNSCSWKLLDNWLFFKALGLTFFSKKGIFRGFLILLGSFKIQDKFLIHLAIDCRVLFPLYC